MPSIHFEKAALVHKDHIFSWLDAPHVKEFWDNSPEHREDILIFMKGRSEPSPYYEGIFDYWVGFLDEDPYCLLMTSEILVDDSDLSDLWREHLSQTGKTISIDFTIGNEAYVGKGLASPALEAFTTFIQDKVDATVDTFMIDPHQNNPRAKHVYEKAGFQSVGEFFRRGEWFFLMIKKQDRAHAN